jgi:hypothetical protein
MQMATGNANENMVFFTVLPCASAPVHDRPNLMINASTYNLVTAGPLKANVFAVRFLKAGAWTLPEQAWVWMPPNTATSNGRSLAFGSMVSMRSSLDMRYVVNELKCCVVTLKTAFCHVNLCCGSRNQ